jgi:hypothetical protein
MEHNAVVNPTKKAAPRSMSSKQLPQAFWNERLAKLDRNAERIVAQLKAAGPQFPDLVAAMRQLSSYVGYIHRKAGASDFLGGPVPSQANWCVQDPQSCQCAAGNKLACGDYEPPHHTQRDPKLCIQLSQEYAAALEAERQAFLDFLANPSPRRPGEYVEGTISKSQEIRNRMFAAGCLRIITILP